MLQRHTSVGDGSVSGNTAKPALPLRAGQVLLRDLIDLYMSHYEGRDPTRVRRLGQAQSC